MDPEVSPPPPPSQGPTNPHSLLGPLVTLPNRLRFRHLLHQLTPTLTTQMSHPPRTPTTILSATIQAAHAAGPQHYTPHEITTRLLMISWASLHTTANTISHALLTLPPLVPTDRKSVV